MGLIILMIVLVIVAVVGPPILRKLKMTTAANLVLIVPIALTLFVAASTSFVNVSDGQVLHLTRLYNGASLPNGRVIATEDGMMGKQARTIRQGFHPELFINILHKVEEVAPIEVGPNQLALVYAIDGVRLPNGQTFAKKVPLEMILDAEQFLANGGQKGPQITVLPPGNWPLNRYLFKVNVIDVTEVPQGHVAVIKSNARSGVEFGNKMVTPEPSIENCNTVRTSVIENSLSNRLVPVGCVGIWETALSEGRYYINTDVYDVTLVDTRQQAWEYFGDYTSRKVDLSVDANGELTQKESSKEVVQKEGSKDGAIAIKVDGYTIYQNVRALVQITAADAPIVVASLGGMDQVEDRVITPAIQSTLRDLSGLVITTDEVVYDDVTGEPKLNDTGVVVSKRVRRPVAALDFINNRATLQTLAEDDIKPEAEKAGVTLREVRFLNTDLPPEVLIPTKRRQLAFQMSKTLIEEEKAQRERIAREKTAAEADKQKEVAQAEINVKIAKQEKLRQQALGEASRLFLEEVAKGQQAQTDVLGADKVMELKKLEMMLAAVTGLLESNPDLINNVSKFVPEVMVSGSGAGDAGSAAILARKLSGMINLTTN